MRSRRTGGTGGSASRELLVAAMDEEEGMQSSAGLGLRPAAAAAVAARGVLFANTRPAPRSWMPLKMSPVNSAQRAVAAHQA
jgi:hypothetical protein